MGCAILNWTLAGFLRGVDAPLAEALARAGGEAPSELMASLRDVPDGVTPEELHTSGYVVHTLQTALYDALTAESAEEAIITAVNRGGDTDTIGAVTGAVAGARFGASTLPERWLSALEERAELTELADQLINLDAT